MLMKGCQGFVVVVWNVDTQGIELENTSIVNEFVDDLLRELLGLHLQREIEFCINLMLGMQPVLIPPNKMVLVELKEFKD